MAQMIPRSPPGEGPGKRAESDLWHALRVGLNDEWFVYYELHFIGPTGREGEIDFLCVHRVHGVLVIECKGKGVRRSGAGGWERQDDDGWEPMKRSPFAQAQRQMHQMIKLLKKRWSEVIGSNDVIGSNGEHLPFLFGYAAAFPRADADEDGLRPLDVPREVCFDVSDLGDMRRAVDRCLHHWRKSARRSLPALDAPAFKRFRKKALHPPFGVIARMSSEIRADEHTLVRVSAEQARVMSGLWSMRRIAVVGGAGTGKTLLAMEAAERYADRGDDVLFVCFNRPLADTLAAQLAREDEPGSLLVLNFHRLCAWAHRETFGSQMDVPDDRDARTLFWRESAAFFYADALDAEKMSKFDAIVVDEAQDFADTWWSALLSALKDPDSGRLILFADPRQDLYERKATLPVVNEFELTVNFRNTKCIAKEVARQLGEAQSSAAQCPVGVAPVVHKITEKTDVKRQVGELIRNLTKTEKMRPEQITILSPHTPKNSSLGELTTFVGLAVSNDPIRRSGAVLHTSIARFKGLESDVVILIDVAADDPRSSKRARYVATSRAKHRLFVWADESW